MLACRLFSHGFSAKLFVRQDEYKGNSERGHCAEGNKSISSRIRDLRRVFHWKDSIIFNVNCNEKNKTQNMPL